MPRTKRSLRRLLAKLHRQQQLKAGDPGRQPQLEPLEPRLLLSATTLAPDADALVRSGIYASTNYGSAPELIVKHGWGGETGDYDRKSLLRFDLSSIDPAALDAGARVELVLQPMKTGHKAGESFFALDRVTDDAWGETTVTWSNQPAVAERLATWQGEVTGHERRIDLTAAVQAELAGDGMLSLRLSALSQGGNKDIIWGSDEHADASLRPRLEVVSPEPLSQSTLYHNDFDSGVNSGNGINASWSAVNGDAQVTATAPSGETFLGEFGNDTLSLDLSGLPGHDQLTLSFDLYTIRSWDGNNSTYGPDQWSLTADGQMLLDTTFSTYPLGENYGTQAEQAYGGPGQPTGSYDAGTGGVRNTLGYTFNYPSGTAPSEVAYELIFSFDHTADTVSFDFSALGLQWLSDESWGIDNVSVSVGGGFAGGDAGDPTPEPGTVAASDRVRVVTVAAAADVSRDGYEMVETADGQLVSQPLEIDNNELVVGGGNMPAADGYPASSGYNNSVARMRFDLPEIPGEITGAKLQINQVGGFTTVFLTDPAILAAPDLLVSVGQDLPWDETGATARENLTSGEAIIAEGLANDPPTFQDRWPFYSVTADVTAMDLSSPQSVTAAVGRGTSDFGDDIYIFGSSEGSYGPTLSIVYELPAVTMQVAPTEVREDAVEFPAITLSRDRVLDRDLTVFLTYGGDAVPGDDYEPLPSQVIIPAGQESVTLELRPVDDDWAEQDATLEIGLAPDNSYYAASPAVSVLVADDETADDDGDGLDNRTEDVLGTESDNGDSDGDGVPDNEEISNGTDPNDGNDGGVPPDPQQSPFEFTVSAKPDPSEDIGEFHLARTSGSGGSGTDQHFFTLDKQRGPDDDEHTFRLTAESTYRLTYRPLAAYVPPDDAVSLSWSFSGDGVGVNLIAGSGSGGNETHVWELSTGEAPMGPDEKRWYIGDPIMSSGAGAGISGPNEGQPGQQVTLSVGGFSDDDLLRETDSGGTATDTPYSDTIIYTWSLGGNSSFTAQGSSVSFTLPQQAGTYTYSVKVDDQADRYLGGETIEGDRDDPPFASSPSHTIRVVGEDQVSWEAAPSYATTGSGTLALENGRKVLRPGEVVGISLDGSYSDDDTRVTTAPDGQVTRESIADTMIYSWSATSGGISGNTPATSYSAPSTAGAYTVTLSVDDEASKPSSEGGTRDDAADTVALEVFVGTLDGLTASDPDSGLSTSDGGGPLVIAAKEFGASFDIAAAWSPSGLGGEHVLWELTRAGSSNVISSGDFASSANTVNLANRAAGNFVLHAGIDYDGDGQLLTDGEETHEVDVAVLGLEQLRIADSFYSGNFVVASEVADDPTLRVEEYGNQGQVDLTVSWIGGSEHHARVVWYAVRDADDTVVAEGSVSAGGTYRDLQLPLVDGAQSGTFTIGVGIDTNNDGRLDGGDTVAAWGGHVDVTLHTCSHPPVGDQVNVSASDHRVDIHGVPLPDPSPTGEGEADRLPNMAHVDMFSLTPSFSTTDVAAPMPGGELLLEFRRTLGVDSRIIHDTPAGQLEGQLDFQWDTETPLGQAWSTNLSSRLIRRITPPSGGMYYSSPLTATVYDELGNALEYDLTRYDTATGYAPHIRSSFSNSGLRATLDKWIETDLATGEEQQLGYKLRKRHGTTLYYRVLEGDSATIWRGDPYSPQTPIETFYLLDRIQDRNGNTLQYTYYSDAELGDGTLVKSIHDPQTLDRRLDFEYANGRLIRVTDPLARAHEYEYENGELARVYKPDPQNPASRSATPVAFTYHATNFVDRNVTDVDLSLSDCSDSNQRIKWYLPQAITDARGHTTTFTYDYQSTPTAIQAEGGLVQLLYESRPHLQSIGTADGNATFTANFASHTARTTTVTDTRGTTNTYMFDADIALAFNDLGFALAMDTVTRTTDVPELPTDHIDPHQRDPRVTYSYSGDLHGNLIAVEDVSGNQVEFIYEPNAINDPRAISAYASFEDPTVDAGETPYGNLYEIFGQPAKSVFAAGTDPGDLNLETQYFYDTNFNKLIKQIDATGVATRYELDNRGNRTRVVEADGTGAQSTSLYAYDARGFVTRTEDPDGRVTRFEPNAYHHLQRTIVEGYASDSMSIGTEREADLMDRTLRQWDPLNGVTVYAYDGWDRVVGVTPPAVEDPTGNATPHDGPVATAETVTEYDLNSNVIREVGQTGRTSVTFYDSFNRPTVSILDDGDGNYGAVLGTTIDDGFGFIEDAGDLVTRWSYGPVGLVAAQIDPKGNRTEHYYDELLRLERTVRPDAEEIHYEYGPNSGSGTFTLGGFNPTRVINARGFATDHVYDAAYRETVTIRRTDDGSGLAHNADRRVDESAIYTTYNGAHNPIRVESVNFDRNGIDNSHVAYTFYDHRHRPTVQAADLDGDGVGASTGTFYDNAGSFVGDGQDLITRTRYDSAGNVTHVTDAEGRTTETVYDGAGRPTDVHLPAVDVFDPDAGLITSFTPVLITQYDLAGNPILTTDASGVQTRTDYDARHRPIRTVLDLDRDGQFELTQSDIADDVVTLTGYDLSGNALYSIDPRGYRTDTTYDAFGRPRFATGPAVADAENGNVLSRPVTERRYDANGNVTDVIDPRGVTTHTVYDALGRATDVYAAYQTPEEVRTQTIYDANSNVEALILHNVVAGVARPQRTDYAYDHLDRQTSETLPAVGDGQTRRTTTDYDLAGNPLTITDPEGQQHKTDYDRAGRAIQSVHQRADGTVEETRTFDYDRAGNLTDATDLNGATAYRYDALDRVIEETRYNNGEPSGPYTVLSDYDRAGNRSRVLYPDASGMPGAGRTLVNRYDARGLLTSVTDGSDVSTYVHDPAGNRTSLTLPNGTTTTAAFDVLSRVTSLETQALGGTAYSIGYTYGLAGNRRTADETWDETGLNASKHTTYDYDPLYRLTDETYTLAGFSGSASSGAYAYAYDLAGNRLTKTVDGVNTTYNHDDLNRLLSESTGGVATTYGYDLNGSRTAKNITGGDQATYAYDTHGRLVSASINGHVVLEADYDHRTRRIEKRSIGKGNQPGGPLEATRYRYDGGTSFQELDDAGLIELELIRGTGMGGGIGSVLYNVRDDAGVLTTEYFAYNAVGHTSALLDASGDVSKVYAYEAFGNIVGENGSSKNDKLANTKERDWSTALDNHGFRYYDPSTGRYVTRDPLGYPDGLNNYVYVNANPVNHVDPEGLQADPFPRHRAQQQGLYPSMGGAGIIFPPGVNGSPFITNRPDERFQPRLAREWDESVRSAGLLGPAVKATDDYGPTVGNFVADSVPVAGTIKGATEVVTGTNPLTGQRLSVGERVLAGGATVISVVPFGGLIGKGLKSGGRLLGLGRLLGRGADDAVGAAQGVVRQGDGLAPERITIPSDKAPHIFRDSRGHLPDTWENRRLLVDVANDPNTTVGPSPFGGEYSLTTRGDGTQVWTHTRNGRLENAGVNEVGKHRRYNPQTKRLETVEDPE